MRTPTRTLYLAAADNAEIDDTKKLIDENVDSNEWSNIFAAELKKSGLKLSDLSDLCGVSENTARGWKKKFPSKRRDAVMLGILFDLDRDTVDKYLMRYGKSNKLYARDYNDYIFIFMIEHRDEYRHAPADEFDRLKNRVNDYIKRRDGFIENRGNVTRALDLSAKSASDEDMLMESIRENYSAFDAQRWSRFYKYVDKCKEKVSFSLEYEAMFLNKNFYVQYSSSKTKKQPLTRGKIIALALDMGATEAMTNKILEYAYMEPLCPRIAEEAVIITCLNKMEVEGYASCFSLYVNKAEACELEGRVSFEDANVYKAIKDILKNYPDEWDSICKYLG